jgi:polyisoprenoid-binding protein YceI
MHGVTNKVTIPATINVQGSKLSASSKFDVQLHDYNIKIPSLVSKQVSESVAVSINCAYEPYSK